VRDYDPDLPCIVKTGFDTVENSIDALRAGAFQDTEQALRSARSTWGAAPSSRRSSNRRLRTDNPAAQPAAHPADVFDNVNRPEPSRCARCFEMVDKVAGHDTTELLTAIAVPARKLIAARDPLPQHAPDRVLVSFNCASIPEEAARIPISRPRERPFTGAIAARVGACRGARRHDLPGSRIAT
jgi:DNA-binding NtrC family response regulator